METIVAKEAIPLKATERPFYLAFPLPLRLALVGLVWVIAYQILPGVADYVSYHALGLDPASHLGSAVGFFLYDVPKILLLLGLIVFLVGILRSFFSPERTRKLLGGKAEGVGNVLAATLGIATPFCSCSAVPLFLGFVESGVPLGVTFSFLIASPMINEVAVVMLFGLFGWQVAGLYVATGLLIAILAGWVIGRLRLERWVEEWVYEVKVGDTALDEKLSFEDRVAYAAEAVKDIVGKVWPYVVAGIALGAAIHGYVPEDFMVGIMGKNAWWSVPAAVAVGIPMYSNAAGIIPIVQALMEKGAALGTVLAFMMAVIALSLPEMIILRRVLKPQLIAVFIGVVGTGIIITGYLFNILL
jgi:uncharacterized membrane protein YraQ (UPF0718 family)